MDLPILGVAARITISMKSGSDVRCRDMFCTIDSIANILSKLKDERLTIEDARIAMGVVAPRPIRAKKAEAALKGKIVSPELFEEIGNIAASEAQPKDSIRGEAWYRSEMIKVLAKRALIKSIDRIIRPDEAIYPEKVMVRNANPNSTIGFQYCLGFRASDFRFELLKGKMKKEIMFTLNGETVNVEVDAQWTLLYLLREVLELTGTKEGCGYGECGACTVIIDGQAVNSCLYPVMEAEGRTITTIEGLASKDGQLHPLQAAFISEGAVQCGFCTPGMIMSAKALLDSKDKPTDEEIKDAIAGNLCRCTGYVKIIDAIKSVAGGR